jgi:hypothetical protein
MRRTLPAATISPEVGEVNPMSNVSIGPPFFWDAYTSYSLFSWFICVNKRVGSQDLRNQTRTTIDIDNWHPFLKSQWWTAAQCNGFPASDSTIVANC